MEQYVIGLDQGTTGTTVLLFDSQQTLIDKTYAEHQQYYPQPAWVEHDPEEIFQNTLSLISKVIQKNSIQASQIKGIGITNQRETTVLWDRNTSKPIYPAIVWQCRRSSAHCDQIRKNANDTNTIQTTTGLTIDPYFSATKISWILDNVAKKTDAKTLAFGTMDSWLIWKLTKGHHVTDFTNASRTLLFDIHKLEWSKTLCDYFNIPMSLLPKVQNSLSHFGNIHKDFFGHEIPILGVLGDQQASLFGHGGTSPMQAKCTFGTGAFALVYVSEKPVLSKHKLLATLACSGKSNAGYALEGSVFMAGSIVQWLRDEIKMISEPAELDVLARSIPDNQGVYMVPAFAGLGAPYWNSDARAIITGMHLGTSRAHFARAALESIAYQVFDLFDAFQNDLGKKITELHVDGGVTQSDFLMQFLSNLLQIPIHRSSMIEMTAFGAAKAAALQAGIWKEERKTIVGKTFQPNVTTSGIQAWLQGWKKAVAQALHF
jgi:glycerol kinase